MTPTETDAVSTKRSSRRRAGRATGSAEYGWAMLSWRFMVGLSTVIPGQGRAQGGPGAVQQDPLARRRDLGTSHPRSARPGSPAAAEEPSWPHERRGSLPG